MTLGDATLFMAMVVLGLAAVALIIVAFGAFRDIRR